MNARQRGNPIGEIGERVGANVKARRKSLGWTQEQLSDVVSKTRPIRLSGISKIEAALRAVDVDDLVALAVALETTPQELLGSLAQPLTASGIQRMIDDSIKDYARLVHRGTGRDSDEDH